MQNCRAFLCPDSWRRTKEDCFGSCIPRPCGVANPAKAVSLAIGTRADAHRKSQRQISRSRGRLWSDYESQGSERNPQPSGGCSRPSFSGGCVDWRVGTLAVPFNHSVLGGRRQSTVANPPGLPVLPPPQASSTLDRIRPSYSSLRPRSPLSCCPPLPSHTPPCSPSSASCAHSSSCA